MTLYQNKELGFSIEYPEELPAVFVYLENRKSSLPGGLIGHIEKENLFRMDIVYLKTNDIKVRLNRQKAEFKEPAELKGYKINEMAVYLLEGTVNAVNDKEENIALFNAVISDELVIRMQINFKKTVHFSQVKNSVEYKLCQKIVTSIKRI